MWGRPSPGSLQPSGGETGRISGTVEISAALASRRPNFRIYADARSPVAPRVPANELQSELRHVVVYIEAQEGIELARGPDSTLAIMSQLGERFDPHVLPVQVGATTLLKASYRQDTWHVDAGNAAFVRPGGHAIAIQLSQELDFAEWIDRARVRPR